MRALPISIYEDKRIGNCSNGGISSRYSEVLLICEEGFIEIDESNPPENLVKLVVRNLWNKEYKHIEPVVRPTGAGWMAGGTLVYSCDSRFRELSDYPLSFHDRQETWEQYDLLSR